MAAVRLRLRLRLRPRPRPDPRRKRRGSQLDSPASLLQWALGHRQIQGPLSNIHTEKKINPQADSRQASASGLRLEPTKQAAVNPLHYSCCPYCYGSPRNLHPSSHSLSLPCFSVSCRQEPWCVSISLSIPPTKVLPIVSLSPSPFPSVSLSILRALLLYPSISLLLSPFDNKQGPPVHHSPGPPPRFRFRCLARRWVAQTKPPPTLFDFGAPWN